MIRALSILLFVLAAGCGTTPGIIPRVERAYVFDLRKHSAEGFLFTPMDYDGEYDPIGPIEVEIEAELVRRDTTMWSRATTYWKATPLAPGEILVLARRVATDLGADAITRMETTSTVADVSGGENTGQIWTGLRLTGFAIKRK